MDFDGVIERKFHYMIIETKDKGIQIPQGQRWTLERLQYAKSITVLYVEGKKVPEKYTATRFWKDGRIDNGSGEGRVATVDFVARWFQWANNKAS